MEICFLGTGSPYPDANRGSSAILVDVGSARILMDCGRDCVQQMSRLGIPPASITHCFLTHAHFDHIADYALMVLTSWRFGRQHKLQVFGPLCRWGTNGSLLWMSGCPPAKRENLRSKGMFGNGPLRMSRPRKGHIRHSAAQWAYAIVPINICRSGKIWSRVSGAPIALSI